MNYSNLVLSIVEDLLDEKLFAGETPADRGLLYRTRAANLIKLARNSDADAFKTGKFDSGHTPYPGVNALDDAALDHLIGASGDGSYPDDRENLAAAQHYAYARNKTMSRNIDREEREFHKEFGK